MTYNNGFYQLSGDGSGLQTGVAVVSSGAALATGLVSAGVAAQAVPIVGNILGALAIAGGFLLKSKARVSGIKNNIKEVDAQNNELRKASAELDGHIRTVGAKMKTIDAQLRQSGLNGIGELDGFRDWLRKTFTPVRYQTRVLNTKVAENAALTKTVETKISTLQQMADALQKLVVKLQQGKGFVMDNKGAFIGAALVAVAGFAFWKSRKKKSVKK